MEEGLAKTYAMLGEGQRMLIEYKFFEPAFYHTDIPDWGLATLYAQKLGPKAQTLVDLGHHPQGTNIEYIIAILIDEGKLGGFHFNNRKYADDDLTTSSINPYELFLIFNEIVAAEQDPAIELDIAYMIDQCHYIKPNIEAMIQSVVNIQTAYAKALLVDRKRLKAAQENRDMIEAEECLVEAFNRDVTPLLEKVREELGVPADPRQGFPRKRLHGSHHRAAFPGRREGRGRWARYLAIDLGAESGRGVVGTLSGGRLDCTRCTAFPTRRVRLLDGLHWDVLSLYTQIKQAIGSAPPGKAPSP